MMKYLHRTLPVLLLIGFLVFAAEKACAKTTQNATNTEAANLTTKSNEDAYVSGVTTGRASSVATGILGLIALVVSWRAKARFAKTGAKIGLALGFVVIALSIVHLVTTAGAVFGSGSGKAGAIVALLLGLISITLSMITLRSRRTA